MDTKPRVKKAPIICCAQCPFCVQAPGSRAEWWEDGECKCSKLANKEIDVADLDEDCPLEDYDRRD